MRKLFVFVVACVALAQVRGDEALDDAIEKGLERAQVVQRNGQKQIDTSIQEVSYMKKLTESKGTEFLQRMCVVQGSCRKTLHSAAESTRQKAKEANKPQSVFECINRVEENANNHVEALVKKFERDVHLEEEVKLHNIDTYAKPLLDMGGSLAARHEKAAHLIKECQNVQCIDIAINSFIVWLDLLFAEMKRIRNQINSAVTNFQRDVATDFNNISRQVNITRTASVKNVKACLLNRSTIFSHS